MQTLPSDGQLVVIENQLGRTDHRHLGQSITYAAEHNVGYVVWIASRFRPEHRAAIDWLNGLAPDKVRFYAVEVHAIKIGGSLPARFYNSLKAQQEEINAEVGSELDWYDGDRRNGPNVTLFTCGSIDDPPERQEEIRAWMSEKLLKFKDVFDPRLEKIIAELEDA